ncbi:elongator complex protein 3 [Desulfogranum japonicum]|uniref:elongator complex protein 3 n=1 Tax=Desulfogranum japonicum TaxID=231447 RepID=UPI0003FD70BA|nr:radical SAM protein [Desulfogranum japonicum]
MPLIIPLFIPHEGCPHACIFCNQRSISGESEKIDRTTVQQTVTQWLQWKKPGQQCMVAFYGGSFSGLEKKRQQELLGAVQPYLKNGSVHGIRISTRPDYIDRQRIALLQEYGVTHVELGVQSLDDEVLERCRRGHSANQVRAAVALLQQAGCVVGMQLMLGLPGQSFTSLRGTVSDTIALSPDMVRIYPALVVAGSRLEQLWQHGRFTPLSLDKAVVQAVYMKKQFDKANIQVIRIGLQVGDSLMQSLRSGPFHPAFGELVFSRMMLKTTRKILAACGKHDNLRLVINPKDQSVFRGLRSANLHRLSELGLLERFSLETSENMTRHAIGCMVEP